VTIEGLSLSFLRQAERIVLAVTMVAMTLMFFVNVMVRWASPRHASAFAWIEEATLFALAWLVFVGLGLALEQRRHIAMTTLLNSAPRAATVIGKLISLTGLVFCAFFAKSSFDLALFIYRSGQISPTLGVSMIALYAPLPVGFVLLGLRYLLQLLGLHERSSNEDAAVVP
jgi:C4-dicarboxylate transporter DctQ subunit